MFDGYVGGHMNSSISLKVNDHVNKRFHHDDYDGTYRQINEMVVIPFIDQTFSKFWENANSSRQFHQFYNQIMESISSIYIIVERKGNEEKITEITQLVSFN